MSITMWEAVEANKHRSAWLMVIMTVLLIGLGAGIGFLFTGTGEGAGYGAFIGACLWGLLLLINLKRGESVLLSSANAREVSHSEAPQLYNIVEEMRLAAGLPAMPKVYIVDMSEPNAFAVGLKPERACVAVTTGLLQRLNRDELQGVLAHEIGHISNRDTLFMTLAGITLGAIVLMADVSLHIIRFGGLGSRSSNRQSSSGQGGGAGQVVLLLVVLALAILAPLLARLLYFACSRQREYLADASAAQYTRYPEALANALRKISGMQTVDKGEDQFNHVVSPMCTINPRAAAGSANIFGTHPPTKERIRRLMEMQGATPPPSETA